MWKQHLLAHLSFLLAISFGSAAFASPQASEQSSLGSLQLGESHLVEELRLRRNSTLYHSLKAVGVSSQDVFQMVEAAKAYVNLSRVRAGARFELVYSGAPFQRFTELRYRMGEDERLHIRKVTEGEWAAHVEKLESRMQTLSFSGRVETSLWESALEAGMDPELVSEMASIFAWQIDFAREVRVGDQWRVLVEQKLVENEASSWGEILAVEYINEGELFSGFLLRPEYGQEGLGYFTLDGESLRRMFLKAPIKFGRISSRFNRRRFHPVLKKHRPHLGVDYAAPIGTPVMAVGDGVVTQAASLGGAGKTIKLRHNSMYSTHYKHLNGYAKGLRRGSRVKQGQIIGYVGNTGLSTGPHLHFELWENGRYVDPLGKKFPSADPVPQELLSDFKRKAVIFKDMLPAWVEDSESAPRGPLFVSIESPQL